MSLAVSRSDGVTVLTLTSDPSSSCPPLCQLLCCCTGLCSKTRRLTFQRAGAQAALGALWILTGLLHIGLWVLLMTRGPAVYVLWRNHCPVWLGVSFFVFGVCCVLAERYPRPIFILLSGLLNLAGVAMSIAGIVYYSGGIDRNRWFYDGHGCERNNRYDYWGHRMTTTVSPEDSALMERCEQGGHILQVLTVSVRAVQITLSVLDLCLGISSAVLSFKALKQGVSKSSSKPLLEETKETTEE